MLAQFATAVRTTRHRFAADERGNIIHIFALLLVPMMAITIGALDYGRANGVRNRLEAALDSGLSFAAQRLPNDPSEAEASFHRAFKVSLPETLRDITATFRFDAESRRLEATAATSVPVHIIGMLEGNRFDIAAAAARTLPPPIAALETPGQRSGPAAPRQLLREVSGDIDPAEIERMVQEIMRRMGR
ncbi:MAG: hypothetical protein KDJ37_05830 [Hyphomicrobiaceae bacterium]|nr:hypothetical protein [Hyphomicrobiaceae bacterium]